MIALGSFALLRPWWLLAFPLLAALSLMTRQIHASLGDWARAVDAPLLAAMLERRGGGAGMPGGHFIFWAIALTALALSGPAFRRADASQFRNLDATLIVMDVSNAASSGARLQETVAAAQLILAQGGARQLGLILYAGDAYLASPLTDDASALSALLYAVDDNTVPDAGARPDRALFLARRILHDARIINADVALISAGEGLDSAATREAARLAKDGHAVHTLFVGAGHAVDGSDAPRRAGMAAMAAAGQGVAGDAARPDGVVARISGRAITHMGGSDLQILRMAGLRPVFAVRRRRAVALVLSQVRAMRRLAIFVVMLLPCVAIWLIGVSAAGPALQALGFPAAAAGFFKDPARKGAALYLAKRWAEAADAFGGDAGNAYNRGNALAHADRYAEAITAYEQALAANPDDEDAAFNKALLADLANEKEAAGGADGIAANSAATKARNTHDEPHADGKTGGSGDGFAGNQQGASAPGAQGSSKAGKFDKGDVKSSDAEQGQGKGSAGDAGGAGGGGGELVDVAKMIRDRDRRVARRRDAASVRPTVEWLSTLPDDPGRFLKLQILAEQARRKEHPDKDDDM